MDMRGKLICLLFLLDLSLRPAQVGVKAKTPEGMGTDNAAIAHAVVLLEKTAVKRVAKKSRK